MRAVKIRGARRLHFDANPHRPAPGHEIQLAVVRADALAHAAPSARFELASDVQLGLPAVEGTVPLPARAAEPPAQRRG
jgi:hypothetical protein